MPTLVIPNSFSPGATIASAEVNADFTAVATLLNSTKLDDDNIQNLGISGTKLKTSIADGSTLQISAGVMSVKAGGIGTSHLAAASVTGPKLDSTIFDGVTLNWASNVLSVKDASLSTAKYIDASVTRAKLEAVGQQISSSSGTFSTTSSADITNLSKALTTSGRPVRIMLQSDGSGSGLGSGIGATTNTSQVKIFRDSTDIATIILNSTGGINGPGVVQHLDAPAAGTYTYKLRAIPGSGATVFCNYCTLVVYEL